MQCSKCNEPLKPVVALDIDGTLGDYHFHFLAFADKWLCKYGGSRIMDYYGDTDLATHLKIDKRTYREVKLAYRQGGMKRSMPIYPGAWRLTECLHMAGVEVWLTTTRPYLRLDNIDPDTREWCRRNDIKFDGLLYDEDKYARLVEIVGAERIVAVLDDDLEQVMRAQQLDLTAFWCRTKYNSKQVAPPGYAEIDNRMDARRTFLDLADEWRTAHGLQTSPRRHTETIGGV